MNTLRKVIRTWCIAGLLMTTLVLGGAVGPHPAQAMDADLAHQRIHVDMAYYTPDVRVLFEEMTLVQVLWERTWYAETACAGSGLMNVLPAADGPRILIPNAGDLSAGGSNVSIKLNPDGEILFIPRVQGQRIRVPMDVGTHRAGDEVLSLTLSEGLDLMNAGQLVWTHKDKGPYGNGHGIPGHIALCDPQYTGPR
jgi:hypothetical protein